MMPSNGGRIIQVSTVKTIQTKIEFFEHELEELVRFLGYLRSTRAISDIPEYFGAFYNHDLSKDENIESVRERICDIRGVIESLKRRADDLRFF